VQERTVSVEQPYVTSATAMLPTLQCAPTNSGLQVQFYVLIVIANRSQSSPQLSFSLHFPINLVWCLESRKPDEWLQDAGGGSAPRQTRWLSRRVQSKNTNTKLVQYGLVQCMNASLGRYPQLRSQFRSLNCFKQGARPASTGSNDTSNLPRATNQLLQDN
jgi:hypothetical protein